MSATIIHSDHEFGTDRYHVTRARAFNPIRAAVARWSGQPGWVRNRAWEPTGSPGGSWTVGSTFPKKANGFLHYAITSGHYAMRNRRETGRALTKGRV
jgi:hypothetical protein